MAVINAEKSVRGWSYGTLLLVYPANKCSDVFSQLSNYLRTRLSVYSRRKALVFSRDEIRTYMSKNYLLLRDFFISRAYTTNSINLRQQGSPSGSYLRLRLDWRQDLFLFAYLFKHSLTLTLLSFYATSIIRRISLAAKSYVEKKKGLPLGEIYRKPYNSRGTTLVHELAAAIRYAATVAEQKCAGDGRVPRRGKNNRAKKEVEEFEWQIGAISACVLT